MLGRGWWPALSFPSHSFVTGIDIKKGPLSVPACQVKANWTCGVELQEERVPALFAPWMNLFRKCVLPYASGFYQKEAFCLWIAIFFKVGERPKKLWINQKRGNIIIIESQDNHFCSFTHISTCVSLHKQYRRHNSKIIYLWHRNAMLLFSWTNVYWEHTAY